MKSYNEQIDQALLDENYEKYRLLSEKRTELNKVIDDLISLKEKGESIESIELLD